MTCPLASPSSARSGTFAHAACSPCRSPTAPSCCRYDNVTLAIDALRAGEADAAFVPIENSVEGAVPATLDELAGGEPLVIAEEAYLPVVFALQARPGTTLADIKTVATHPHAEAQVRRWLITNLPDAQVAWSARPPARPRPSARASTTRPSARRWPASSTACTRWRTTSPTTPARSPGSSC